jgi:hypothetical protein
MSQDFRHVAAMSRDMAAASRHFCDMAVRHVARHGRSICSISAALGHFWDMAARWPQH